MARQLKLMEVSEPEWKLDEHTREVGKQGVEQAREALRRALQEAHHPHAA
jgi:hypothetical protein